MDDNQGFEPDDFIEDDFHSMSPLRRIQAEHLTWAQRNFPDQEPWHSFVGMSEELGEAGHAFLKATQGIRGHENHEEELVDALADMMIYMINFANLMGIDLHDALESTWDKVRQRDWQEKPDTAHQES